MVQNKLRKTLEGKVVQLDSSHLQHSEHEAITLQPMNPFNTSMVWFKPVFPLLPHCPDLLTPSITLSACPCAAMLLKLK